MPSWASMAARRWMTLSRTPPRGFRWLDMVQARYEWLRLRLLETEESDPSLVIAVWEVVGAGLCTRVKMARVVRLG
jgi:hypothetical protein